MASTAGMTKRAGTAAHGSGPSGEPLARALAGLWRELPALVVCSIVAGTGVLVQQLSGGISGLWYFPVLTLLTLPLLLALTGEVSRAMAGEGARVARFFASTPRSWAVSCWVSWPFCVLGMLTQVAVYVWSTQHLTWVLLPVGTGLVLCTVAYTWATLSALVLSPTNMGLRSAGREAVLMMVIAPVPAASLPAALVVANWAYGHLGVAMFVAGPLFLALVWAVTLDVLRRRVAAVAHHGASQRPGVVMGLSSGRADPRTEGTAPRCGTPAGWVR